MLTAVFLALTIARQPGDSLTLAAEAALRAGEPWRATRILAPLVDRPETRTPEVLLLAAQAAAGWDGWSTVTRLLASQPWLGREQAGLGQALLARAALERADPTAAALARRAVDLDPDAPDRGARLVVLARALDRAGRYDSAARAYQDAAALLPAIADWLTLRAAGVIGDSATRAGLYTGVTTPAATARVRWTEALARERTGDRLGAARIYASLGATLASLRLRLAAARSAEDRAPVRRDLITWLDARPPAAEVPDAITLLDRNFSSLRPEEQLIVARRAAAAGLLLRAHQGFVRAAGGARLGDADRLLHGTVLARLNRHAEAVARFESVENPAQRAEARYQRARSLLRLGQADRALAELRAVRDSFPGAASGAVAGWLLGDNLVDRQDDSLARVEWLATARRHPRTAQGDRAAFQAAVIAWVRGDHRAAAAEFDSLADRAGPENTAGLYWSGRAWAELGDSARARLRWTTLVTQQPQSYYVVPAARRLGVSPFADTTAGTPAPLPPPPEAAPPALARAALLDSLGMDVEARFELERFARDAQGEDLVRAGLALLEAGYPSRALQLAMRAASQRTPAAAVERLLYPVVRLDVLEREATAVGLAPSLVAGLIRQESLYDPRARSRADARGLMQVMPAVGAAAARGEGFPEWDVALLYQPDVNMHIGLRHLAERWAKCGGSTEAALAAYNAGSTPVNRWLERPGTTDPEVFIERIPYVETRDYVRRVLYNEARYQAIYGRDRAGGSPAPTEGRSAASPPR